MKSSNVIVLWIKEKGKKILEDDGIYIYGSISNITDSKEKELNFMFI